MFTGRDVAKFVSQVTGQDYVGLYDEGEKENEMMKNEAKKNFMGLVERMDTVRKNNTKDLLD